MCNPMCLNYLINYSHDHHMIEFSARLCAPEIVSLSDYMNYFISIIQVLKIIRSTLSIMYVKTFREGCVLSGGAEESSSLTFP